MSEKPEKTMDTKSPNFWIAVSLIVVGLLLLLDNFDMIDADDLWQYWPMILILIGLAKLKSSSFQDKSSAITLLSIGVFFLLFNLDILDWDIIWQLWPIILILIGISIIRRRKSRPAKHIDNRIDMVAIFAGNKKAVSSTEFEGGHVTAIFGGAQLDMSQAKLSDGDNLLDVVAMFGGVEIRVPRDWNIQLKGVPIFGGFEDARRNVSPEEKSKSQTLVLKGLVLFGGLEIKEA